MGTDIKHIENRLKKIIIMTLLTLTLPLFSQQTGEYTEEIKIFEDFVIKQMAIDQIPGLSIGFIKDDFMWAKGFGYADLEHKIPASSKSAYRLASNTKSMTAVAILQLVEKGKIDLDAEVQKYVPYFPRKRWPITVRQLLGHLGGISHYKDYDAEGHIKEHKDTRDALNIFSAFELIAEPGTKYNYSSYGYNLLGAVVEGAAKQSYGNYLHENLWKPLAMNDTYMDDPDEIIPNRVQGYRLVDGEIKNSEFIDISSRFAAGGTISTVVDLLKYGKGLDSGKVLSKESIDLMYTSMATNDGRYVDYGMGWRIDPVNGRFQVYHTGGQAETRTLLVKFPKENFIMALAYNFEGANLHNYTRRLAQLILDEPWNRPVYTGSIEDDALYQGILDVFNHGLCYFTRHEKSFAENDVKEAFAYFNQFVNQDSLSSNYKRTVKKIKDGRHRIAGDAFIKMGSYMAMKLTEGIDAQRVEHYHKTGAITFFKEYADLCGKQHLPEAFHLHDQFEKMIADWYQQYSKTCTDYTRHLFLMHNPDIQAIGKKLEKIFSGSNIYPDFTGELADVTRHFYIHGDNEKALESAKLSEHFFPKSVVTCVYLANVYICTGEEKRAHQQYQKAMDINPDDQAISAGRLYRYADDLAYNNKLDEAMQLLNIAVQLYPEEARLYHGMAEIHLKRSKEHYQKALEIDPTFEPAREILKKIQ